ncbi:MAG: hypothetical protein J6A21_01085 [Lentisphaeria bacterium]|nr:hypothetical protein [Lentisphaeria bacterium]
MKSTAWIPAAAGAALLLAGCAARLPEEELCLARARLDKCLDNASTQSEMNIISADIYALARMERFWIEFRIWNQPGYDKIEKAYMKDRGEWERKAKAEAEKPSPYEGGTLAPYELNRRMECFEQKRIDELKTKWRKP